MVETKCIHVDRAQATAAQDAMTADTHWEALVALHRTLLHEHHDFFLATQHPSASPALRRLAVKYGMPGRMWRNGIRSVLDIFSSNPNMRPEQMQEFLRTLRQSMDMLQENIPGMGGEWTKIEAALTNFEMFLHDLRSDFYHDFSSSSSSTGGTPPYYGYLQSLYERTDPQHYPWTDQEVEFGDKYVIKPNTANNNRQDEVPWLPQTCGQTLWAHGSTLGQAICWNNFNIFAKVFAVLIYCPRNHLISCQPYFRVWYSSCEGWIKRIFSPWPSMSITMNTQHNIECIGYLRLEGGKATQLL